MDYEEMEDQIEAFVCRWLPAFAKVVCLFTGVYINWHLWRALIN